jgi:hypothetical protein
MPLTAPSSTRDLAACASDTRLGPGYPVALLLWILSVAYAKRWLHELAGTVMRTTDYGPAILGSASAAPLTTSRVDRFLSWRPVRFRTLKRFRRWLSSLHGNSRGTDGYGRNAENQLHIA